MSVTQPHKIVYLDNAAATPVSDTALKAMQPYFSEKFYNASSIYLDSKGVSKDIEEARKSIARQIGAKPTEIIFTSGATEANNLAIKGVMSEYPGSNIVISAIEHPAVSKPANEFTSHQIRVSDKGIVDVEDLIAIINDETVLVSVIAANNEIGSVQPLKEISLLVKSIRKDRENRGVGLPIYLHSDASQLPNYKNVDVLRMGVDLLTISSAKIYGPKGVGLLYVNKDCRLSAQLVGGGQEFGVRSGTENAAAIIGFESAFTAAQNGSKEESDRILEIRNYFAKELLSRLGEEVTINTPLKKSLPNFLNVSFIGQDGERLVMELDEKGIMVSTGSACSANSENRSPTLLAMGLDKLAIDSSIRFSLGRSTTKADIDYALSVITSII